MNTYGGIATNIINLAVLESLFKEHTFNSTFNTNREYVLVCHSLNAPKLKCPENQLHRLEECFLAGIYLWTYSPISKRDEDARLV